MKRKVHLFDELTAYYSIQKCASGPFYTQCGLVFCEYKDGVRYIKLIAADDTDFVTCKRCLAKRGKK